MKPHQPLQAVFYLFSTNLTSRNCPKSSYDQFYGFASYFSEVHIIFFSGQTQASTIAEKQTDQ